MNNLSEIYNTALNLDAITEGQAITLYKEAKLSELIYVADKIRKKVHPDNVVTWIVDRNVNITNGCIGGCKFCNFHTKWNSDNVYTTTIEEYCQKIDETIELDGDQLLLQGGMHPKYKIDFYEDLFASIKERYPEVKLHALGPPEIVHIAKVSRISTLETLKRLNKAGLDSLPGAGAEILVDRVRTQLSPGKATADAWLAVMKEAHQLKLVTSATMMFGHIETIEERVSHLIKLRDLQNQKDDDSDGFTAFIPWPVIPNGTELEKQFDIPKSTALDYVRLIAISRIVLNNIKNIQASWLTVGVETGQLCLHAGANDFGSIMIEENVVSSAGIHNKMDAEGMQRAILAAGFTPRRRDQAYNLR